MMMAVMFVFTSCEKADPVVNKPVDLEAQPDFLTMSEEEIIEYYQSLDPNTFTGVPTQVISHREERPTGIQVRANCTLELRIRRTAGSAPTSYVVLLEEVGGGSLPIVYAMATEGTWESTGKTVDDTKSYDIIVVPQSPVSEDLEYWLDLRESGHTLNAGSVSMITWDEQRRITYPDFDNFDCSPE